MKIVKNKIELKKEDFSYVCPLRTSDMKSVEGGYFCEKCEKKVHDVSDFTFEEFNELKKKNVNVCVSFQKVAMVSLALTLSACSTSAVKKVGKNSEKGSCKSNINPSISKHKLHPFKVLDKNQTIKVNSPRPIRTAGMPIIPEEEN